MPSKGSPGGKSDILIAVGPVAGFKRSNSMVWTIAVILLVLWLLGFLTKYTLGGWIHILLVIAIVVVIINLIQGRRAG